VEETLLQLLLTVRHYRNAMNNTSVCPEAEGNTTAWKEENINWKKINHDVKRKFFFITIPRDS
jgi:hypothetical protein